MFVRIFPVSIDCSPRDVAGFLSDAHDAISGSMLHGRLPMADYLSRYGVRQDIMFQYSGGLFQ